MTLLEKQILVFVHDKSKTIHLWVFINMNVDPFHLSFLNDQVCASWSVRNTGDSHMVIGNRITSSIPLPHPGNNVTPGRRFTCGSLKTLRMRLHGCFRQHLQTLHDPHSYSTSQRGQEMIFLCHKCFWGCGGLAPASSQTHSLTNTLAHPPQLEGERIGRMKVRKYVG